MYLVNAKRTSVHRSTHWEASLYMSSFVQGFVYVRGFDMMRNSPRCKMWVSEWVFFHFNKARQTLRFSFEGLFCCFVHIEPVWKRGGGCDRFLWLSFDPTQTAVPLSSLQPSPLSPRPVILSYRWANSRLSECVQLHTGSLHPAPSQPKPPVDTGSFTAPMRWKHSSAAQILYFMLAVI